MNKSSKLCCADDTFDALTPMIKQIDEVKRAVVINNHLNDSCKKKK
jgi:hypothetical protein